MNTLMHRPLKTGQQADYQAIIALLNDYFDGLYEGDIGKLQTVFHDEAVLSGNGYRKTRDDWLTAVAKRPVPREEGLPYGFKILSLEVVGDQGMAKVDAPLLNAHFIDFLGLLREDGRWRIVSKLFTTV